MTKRAFLIGCNSAGLVHCDTDAALMRKALEQHKYEITHIEDPELKTPYYNLLKPLQIFVNSCEDKDTMVFYFAGHSLNLGKENYKFVLADDINNSDNQLLASILIPILRQSKAADKLLIFDCCQSGKAAELVYDWSREAGEYFRIFTATSSKATALEVDGETGGGLFTSWVYRGLTIDTAVAADADGYLRVGKLGEYACSRAISYKSPGGRPAPKPRIYGSTDQDITLTEQITPTYNPSTGYPRPLITELQSIMALHALSAEQVSDCLSVCLAHSDPPIPLPGCDRGDLDCALNYLSAMYYMEGNDLALPLVSFVVRLAEILSDPPDICAWLERTRDWLREHGAAPVERIEHASEAFGPTGEENDPYLLVEVAPRATGSGYELYGWLQDGWGEQTTIEPQEDVNLDAVPRILEAVLNEIAGPRPKLELFLPKRLLTDEDWIDRWEQWELGPPPQDPDDPPNRTLGIEYCLSLRCRERIREQAMHAKCGFDRVADYWRKNRACLSKPISSPCVEWLNALDGAYIASLHRGVLALGLRGAPPTSYLRAVLNAGAPIVLWPRRTSFDKSAYETLRRYVDEKPVSGLPEAVRELRELAWAHSADFPHEGGLSLLWDDPGRVPEMADVPLESVPLEFPS